ncbi:hypothetical protein PUR34_19455 [Streptomyces sp. JV185]|uniref:hypothetical protein n=1 Tax=Streptomyces sp. JV185 TaxID=858638 RepID=UPI002E777C3F|nr:hypothetical protein [Streptomyces sp. JV185]MEE1770254.1 hypothetical protein [Streptomyces sp. JV185]
MPDCRKDIEKVFTLQARQSKAMLGGGGRIAGAFRPLAARAPAHTPLYGRILRAIAFGARPVTARSDLFGEAEPTHREAAGT